MYYLILPISLYTSFVFFLIVTLLKKRIPIPSSQDSLFPVSIVIPFRNEEQNLARLIESLENQVYSSPVEILLINDGSTDHSVQILEKCTQSIQYDVKIIDLLYDPSKKLTSKQQAIDLGIKKSNYEWIILTDADMTYDRHWIMSLIVQAKTSSKTALVFGHTSILPSFNFFKYFQGFQLEFLFSAAYAFHLAGITGSCMGNNMAISKKHYFNCGGFDKIGHSIVEDRALIAALKKDKALIAFATPFKPMAFTQATIPTCFFQQILRWASGGFSTQSNLLIPALLVLVQNLCFFTIPIFPFSALTILLLLNFLLTWLFITLSFSKIQSSYNPIFFPLYYILLQFETILVGWALLFRPHIVWKGRHI